MRLSLLLFFTLLTPLISKANQQNPCAKFDGVYYQQKSSSKKFELNINGLEILETDHAWLTNITYIADGEERELNFLGHRFEYTSYCNEKELVYELLNPHNFSPSVKRWTVKFVLEENDLLVKREIKELSNGYIQKHELVLVKQ